MMNTPVVDFVRQYQKENTVRLHMPGHKGKPYLGFEAFDLTEVRGADSLYEASGILAESEKNAAALFGTAGTFYSTEGSSHCIRAMLFLALSHKKKPVLLAARNAHRALISAAALLDIDVKWLYGARDSLCRCRISPQELEDALKSSRVDAVYLTSPDYLGTVADISALAAVAHRYSVPLLVDNAHGAYLHFLPETLHPIDLGADFCCDSAHKTLPVLTGGAYLHIKDKKNLSDARRALALFGSTSPSYLILQSLDLANRILSDTYPQRLAGFLKKLSAVREELLQNGYRLEESDPLRITLEAQIGERLREKGIECEYEDPDFTVLMLSPDNTEEELQRFLAAAASCDVKPRRRVLSFEPAERVCSIREAMFAPSETVPLCKAAGRVLASPTASCPPAVPILVSGEKISRNAIELLSYYGTQQVCVLR